MSKIPIFNGVDDMSEWVVLLSNSKLIHHIKNLEGGYSSRVASILKAVEKTGMSRIHKIYLQDYLIDQLKPRYKRVT